MAKINYRQCDICGEILKLDRCINGYRIWNRLFNKLDICNNCMKKIKKLSVDKDIEIQCLNYIGKMERNFTNNDEMSAYYQGVEDCLAGLSHYKLAKIK